MRNATTWVLTLAITCFFSLSAVDQGVAQPLTFSAKVDFGSDVGQSFGSLFEVKNEKGQTIAGAGFQDVYNTRFRNDRHTLQFFVRPTTGVNEFEIERLPHPDLGCGVYLFDIDEQLYAWTYLNNNSVRRWDEKSQKWVDELPSGIDSIRSGDGIMRLGKGTLSFSQNIVRHNDRVIQRGPEVGHDYCYYYAQGHLCFYRRGKSGEEDTTHVFAIPWTPGSGEVDATKAVSLKTKYPRSTPFVWGQFNDQILTVCNYGGIYVLENAKWRTVLEPSDRYSYQVYSMLNWHDRLLLAQYPTGNVFEYRGESAKHIENWPPRIEGVSKNARECQTLSIYRGELMAGVWPWAELWRCDGNDLIAARDEPNWHSMGRMFSHPELTDKKTHPYEDEAKRFKLVANHWGQRITGMVPMGDALYLSTSSKGTSPWEDRFDFLTDKERREYGAVLRLRMSGNLAAQIEWTDRPLELEFVVASDRLQIKQDGKLLGETTLTKDLFSGLKNDKLKVTWGDGINGSLRGKLLHNKVTK